MTLDKNIKNIIDGIDLKSIVRKSMKSELSNSINEAYVAEPKVYKQVSDYMSSKTKDAHKSLYNDYVKTSNRISAELDSVNRDMNSVNSSYSKFKSLKEDETYNINATWLHELYFANCFDPHSQINMDMLSYMKLERDFGTFDKWQEDFIACALSAGEGWAVCGYNIYLKRYVNTFINNHSDSVMLGLYPVLVVDMWAHSYYNDYLNDKKSYLISRMREVDWDIVEGRVAKAEAVAGVMK